MWWRNRVLLRFFSFEGSGRNATALAQPLQACSQVVKKRLAGGRAQRSGAPTVSELERALVDPTEKHS